MDRKSFHLPDKHYLLSHSVGAQPKGFDAAFGEHYGALWREKGAALWDHWLATIDRFTEGLAPLIGADAKDICPQPNVSSALTKILFGLPERPGRKKIVLTEDDFPTIGFVLSQAQRAGYELEFLPGGTQLADPDAWAPAFEEDVQLVLATHVFSNHNTLSPVAEITKRARAKGVFSIIDAAQSAGGVPIDLAAWAPDFCIGTSLKYLCGGTGAAFLWASPEVALQSAPMDVGWFSHENPFEFDIRNFTYANGAKRFLGGTPSVAPFAGAIAGQKILAAHGLDNAYTHNQSLMTRLFANVPIDAVKSMSQQGRRGNWRLDHAARL